MGTLNYSEPILYIILKIFVCVQNVEENLQLKIVKAVCFEKWLLKYLNIQKHERESYLGFDGNLSNIKHQPNPTQPIFLKIQYLFNLKHFLRFFGTHVAQPGSIGQDHLAVATYDVIAHLTLAGKNSQSAQRLQASATAMLTVFFAGTFGPFPLNILQLCLQLPEPNTPHKCHIVSFT